MRDKGGRRRFRPGWMQPDDGGGGGIDNPAMSLSPEPLEPIQSATFSIGDEPAGDVAITVTDYDQDKDKEDTSMV